MIYLDLLSGGNIFLFDLSGHRINCNDMDHTIGNDQCFPAVFIVEDIAGSTADTNCHGRCLDLELLIV